MDIYKQKFTKLQQGVFRLLCIKVGTALSQREIARLLGVSPTAVAKALRGLLAGGLITVQRRTAMNLISVSLNRDNPQAAALKRVDNLRVVYESGLSDALEEAFPGCTIVLFGSYARGEDTMASDIDIAVIGTKGKQIDLARFEKALERPVRINFYTGLAGMDRHLKSNICNGITLVGAVEV